MWGQPRAKWGLGGQPQPRATPWGAAHPCMAPPPCPLHHPKPPALLSKFKMCALVHGGLKAPNHPQEVAKVGPKLLGPSPKWHTMVVVHLGLVWALALGGGACTHHTVPAIKCASGWGGQAKAHAPKVPHWVAHASPWVALGTKGSMVWPTPWLHHLHHLAPTHAPTRAFKAHGAPHPPMGAMGAWPPMGHPMPPTPGGVALGCAPWVEHGSGPWHCVALACTTFKFNLI